MPELRECKLCGSPATESFHSSKERTWVCCGKPDGRCRLTTVSLTIEDWNILHGESTRPAPQPESRQEGEVCGCGHGVELHDLVLDCCAKCECMEYTPKPLPQAAPSGLKDAHTVHVNMLRGEIAKLTPAQVAHLYDDAQCAEIVAEIKRQRPASQAAPSGQGDMPEASSAEWREFIASEQSWMNKLLGEATEAKAITALTKKRLACLGMALLYLDDMDAKNSVWAIGPQAATPREGWLTREEVLAVPESINDMEADQQMRTINELCTMALAALGTHGWESLRAWACDRQRAECEHRPDVNIYKRMLYNTWQQVIDKADAELAALSLTRAEKEEA